MFKADDYRLKIQGMREVLKEAEYALDIEHLRPRLIELEKEQENPDVWQDLERSTKIGREISALRNKITAYEQGYKKERPAFERSKIVPFIDNMKDVLPAADIAITRSGAMTVSELAAAGTPAILIPSPNVSANHQLKNALAFEEAGAAVIIEEKDLTKERVLSEITALISDKRKLSKMAFNARKMANKKCKTEIIRIIEKAVDN